MGYVAWVMVGGLVALAAWVIYDVYMSGRPKGVKPIDLVKDYGKVSEERIKAVGDEAEAWLAREHPLTVGQAEQLAEPRGALRTPVYSGYEPPYVRLRCPSCGNEKDAWVKEDGWLEDQRDAECRTDDRLPCFGKGMVPIDE